MGISWLLVIAVVVIFVQHRLFRRFGFHGLRIKRQFNQTHCHVGDEILMKETIINSKLLPLPWLRLESMIPAGLRFGRQTNLEINRGALLQNHRSLFSLMPYTKIVRSHPILCAQRGWFKLDSAAVSIGDIVGLEAAVRTQKTSLELLVYPKLLEVADIPLPSSSWQGDIVVKRWMLPDPFLSSGVREYRYGDAMSSIHWKATARSGKLQVYNQEHTADPKLLILVNTQITETMWDAVSDPELVEKALAYAATMADYAIRQGVPVGFGCNSYLLDQQGTPVFLAPQGGLPQLHDLLESMAKLAMACSRTFHDYLENGMNLGSSTALDIVLITAFQSAHIEEQIERLEWIGHSVYIIPLEHHLVDAAAEEVDTQHEVREAVV
ncbi:DUF58 domain-containing protein [Paenibacillus hexagrammi]|uniref:DUF58 domain-containing protein n=1 Tax=Paenibacillus hexagrammi TaxID=2908839 RepID=A0ABY3SHA4_9BACL|nr:DUF58 domain-containing protein [Paenibacillus sp. YPD9-1]UJF32745.1 DUF58 domain-containing protein [Paenibacillus sp. YPD9-1]